MKRLLAAFLLSASAPLAHTQGVSLGSVDGKLQGDLATTLASLEKGELLPVSIVLKEQAPTWLMSAARDIPDKAARREFVITTLKEIATETQAAVLTQLGTGQSNQSVGAEVTALWIANVIVANVNEEMALQLAKREDVAWLHHDRPLGEEVLVGAAASPLAGGPIECGTDLMGADEVWDTYGITGGNVVVAVIDTGLCSSHPGIAQRLWTNPGEILGNGIDDDGNGFVDDRNGWNFESNNANIQDSNGHGSHTAGTVAGEGAGGQQVGVAPGARVMVCKFFNSFSGESSVWQGQQYALANGAHVSSASLGWPHNQNPDRATWRMVCENSIAGGLVVVYAAGNEGCSAGIDNVRTPGDVPDVITVGATDCNDALAGFSSCGPVSWTGVAPYNDHPFPPGLIKPTIAAPGVNTISHNLCGGYFPLSGTSMSTPHVAGAIALLLQADPTLDQFGVENLLRTTAVDLGAPGLDNNYGSGRVDIFQAVTAALGSGTFCSPKTNTCGTVPAISTSGNASLGSNSGFSVIGSNARPGQFGILAYTNNGLANPPTPFFGGELCLQTPLNRGPIVTVSGAGGGCTGTLSLDMNAFANGLAGGNPAGYLSVPGTLVTCQWWARDNGNVYLTGGLSYTVTP